MFIYPNTISTFTGTRNLALRNGYVEISDADYADLIEGKKKWSNGEIVEDPAYEEKLAQRVSAAQREKTLSQIASLKRTLANTDYKALKYAECYYTEEEYAPIKAEREALREQIRALTD